MKHHKTITKGCSGSRVGPHNSEIVRYSDNELYAYATLITLIGSAFAKAQLYYQENIIDKPYNISVIVSPDAFTKYKASDPDTKMERLEWLIENMATPGCGAIISIYVCDKIQRHMDSSYCFNTLWHTEQLWNGSESDYVTVQTHSEIDHNNGKSTHRVNVKESIATIRDVADFAGYKIIEVDYTTPIDELHKLLIGAKAHFGYIGSTGYMSALTRTPTIYIGRKYGTRTVLLSEYAAPWESKTNDKYKTIPSIIWNNIGTPAGRTLMYNREHEMMYHNEPEYYDIAFGEEEIKSKTLKALLWKSIITTEELK